MLVSVLISKGLTYCEYSQIREFAHREYVVVEGYGCFGESTE